MSKVYFSLGGNSGDRLFYFRSAIKLISENIGKITSSSSIYETESWGYDDSANYLNQVIEINSDLSPEDILVETQHIEKKLGRNNKSFIDTSENLVYSARIIDIDILFYDDKIIEQKDLIIPHRFLHLRNFVLKPLNEIAPELLHPVINKNIEFILHESEDKMAVKSYTSKTQFNIAEQTS